MAQNPTGDARGGITERMRGDGAVTTADVVIVGGGIVGVSTAFFLAEAGAHDVVVLERATVGAGASGRAAGVMLMQGDSDAHLRFQLESIQVHRRLQAELETDLVEHGSLMLWTSPEAAARVRALVPLHDRFGVALEVLTPDETRARFPYLATGGVVAATFSARDPWATPLATVQRVAEAARARGVVIREHCEVTGVELEDGRVQRVLTWDGPVATPIVVNAAGAWARVLGEMTGLRIPVVARKRQVFVLDPAGVVPPDSPFIMEEDHDFYCKRRPEGLIMVCGQTEGETFETAVEWGYLDDALDPTLRLIPGLREARVTGAWAGIRPLSPDGRPFLGPVSGFDGYIVAGGFGGQGFTQGPLAGQLVAELITAGRPHLDLAPYEPQRLSRARGR